MAASHFRTDIKTGQFPATIFLKNRGQRVWSLAANEVLNHNRVFTCGQAGYIELCAIGGLSAGPENTANKVPIGAGSGTGIQQEYGPDLGMGSSEIMLVVRSGTGH